jgi:hypothetical protein
MEVADQDDNDRDLPRDPTDERYVRSFAVDDDVGVPAFFSKWGFVVFRDVFTEEECAATRDAMWSMIECANPGFVRDDPKSWVAFKAAGKYGLSSRGPVFDPTVVANRQNSNLAQALSLALGIPVDDVMVSHDRFTIYRATQLEDSCPDVDGSLFRTGRRTVHLDLNPWWWLESSSDILIGANTLQYSDAQDFIKENNLVVRSMGPHVQCVLNFADNVDADGGTLIVPRFPQRLENWTSKHTQLRKPVPFVTFSGPAGVKAEEALLGAARRVAMRQGSVLVWNQTCMHGTEPNDSARPRLAQFLKAFSRSAVFSADASASCAAVSREDNAARLARRSAALEALLAAGGADKVVSALGRRLFALDVLGDEHNL